MPKLNQTKLFTELVLHQIAFSLLESAHCICALNQLKSLNQNNRRMTEKQEDQRSIRSAWSLAICKQLVCIPNSYVVTI